MRATALGALARCDALTASDLVRGGTDGDPLVRRRAAQLLATWEPTGPSDADAALGAAATALLDDADPSVVEVAAWAVGEHASRAAEHDRTPALPDPVDALVSLAADHQDLLVREAAVAALGAIGDERGRAAILAALGDKPAIRRRAVLALAPFEGPDVEEALARALHDRDWQVRQAAEDLTDP
ncbi:MAG: HEAT repeat domain-containing protein [Acidimicrobiales bacterium]|nr:HEAT repeat domain-containing protein [Acidimicrobiales bacterium]